MIPTDPDPEIRFAEANGARFAYVERGAGETVVMVHGSASDYRDWCAALPHLAAAHRAIAYSRRHHHPNRSGGDGSDYSTALHVEDLAALIETLGGAPVHVVGHSYGAQMACTLALRHPRLVRTLVLCEPLFPGLLAGTSIEAEFAAEMAAFRPRMREALAAGREKEALRELVDWVFGPPGFDGLAPARRAALLDNAEAFRLQMTSVVEPSLECADAARIETPVTFVLGSRSPRVRRVVAERFAECRPGTEIITVEAVSHGVPYEAPEAFARAVSAFLARHSAGA